MLRTLIFFLALAFVACTPDQFYEGTIDFQPEKMTVSLSYADNQDSVEAGTIVLNPDLYNQATEQSGLDRETTFIVGQDFNVRTVTVTMDETDENFRYLSELEVIGEVNGVNYLLGKLALTEEDQRSNSLSLEPANLEFGTFLLSSGELNIRVRPVFAKEFTDTRTFDMNIAFAFDFLQQS